VEHLLANELALGLDEIRRAPSETGTVELIALRPSDGERRVVDEANADVTLGLVGDNWSTRPNRHTPDGRPDPQAQVTLMGSRAAALFTRTPDRWALAGDQLYVDFDLSEANVPAGTRLAVGTAILEVTDEPHKGCAKFRRRFGDDALRLVNSPDGTRLHLRGINTTVVHAGAVRCGDSIRKA
jgi:hypothetical protein